MASQGTQQPTDAGAGLNQHAMQQQIDRASFVDAWQQHRQAQGGNTNLSIFVQATERYREQANPAQAVQQWPPRSNNTTIQQQRPQVADQQDLPETMYEGYASVGAAELTSFMGGWTEQAYPYQRR